jgi:hypothetical protein
MTLPETATSPHDNLNQHGSSSGQDSVFQKLVPVVITAAFFARLIPAWRYFLNPDEALHNLLASQSSLILAYRGALTNAHPPLLILLLYYWRSLGQSELMLRIPSVLAGTASCWLLYQWLKLITSRGTAFTGLLLFAFAPTLILMSAEVRQYPLLLFFITACLYLSELAVRNNSSRWMMLFSLSLYGAILTHYSSLLFAGAIGVYMLVRLYPYGKNLQLFATWASGQAGGMAIASYYLLTHVRQLRANGMASEVAETYVRKSLFHPRETHLVSFIAVQTLRFFTYLFSHGLVGTLALIAFVTGIALLFRARMLGRDARATHRQLAVLFCLPFVLDCGAALAGLYPYGGTRHCLLLAPFAVAGISIAVSEFWPSRLRANLIVIAIVLVFCNLFPSPPPLIRARNQTRSLMIQAVDALHRSVSPGSVIIADHESGLLLGYYDCRHGVVQVFPPFVSFAQFECGPYTVITPPPSRWRFSASDLPGSLADVAATYHLDPRTRIWLFDAGWITDLTPGLIREPRVGCSAPQTFGENILLCRLTGPGKPKSDNDASLDK